MGDLVTLCQIVNVLPRPWRPGRDDVCANQFRQNYHLFGLWFLAQCRSLVVGQIVMQPD